MAKARKNPKVISLRTLIQMYTDQRDWFMVERLFNDLGRLFEEEATS